MATAKDIRQAIQKCANDALQANGRRDVHDRAHTFACYLTGWLSAMGEAGAAGTLRQLLDLPALPTGDGA